MPRPALRVSCELPVLRLEALLKFLPCCSGPL